MMTPTIEHARRHPAFWLAVLLAIPAGEIDAGPPRPGEVKELRRKIDGLLREELTRRWYPLAVDRERGGFHQDFARDWSPLPEENRFLVYQARMTWTAAAFAAYSPPHREEYAKYARHGIEYLDRVMRDRQSGGFHWMLSPEGRVDPRLGDEKHVYGTAFVLYAASKAHEVTRDELALKVARDAFGWLEAHAHDAEHGGYFEAIRRDGTPIVQWDEDAPIAKRTDRLGVYYGFKSMNAHIHLLEAIAEFARVEKTPLVERRLREMHAIVRDRIAVEPGALNLYLTRDWRAIPAHDSFGHDIETAYLLVEAAEVLGIPDDAATWHMARRLVDHALDWGWDEEHGGFYYKGEAFAGEAYDTAQGLVDAGGGAERPAADAPQVRRGDGSLLGGVPEGVGVHRGAPARPGPRRLVHGDDPRGQAPGRRAQGDPLEGELPHVAGDDERGDPARRDGGGRGRGRK